MASAHLPSGERTESARRTIRVLVICSKAPPAPAPESAHAAQLCKQLAAAGLEVHLLTSSTPRPSPATTYSVHPVMKGWGWRDLPALARTILTLRPQKVMLLHVGWIYEFHPMITFLPTYCRFLSRSTTVVTLFENIQDGSSPWAHRLGRATRLLPRRAGIHHTFGTLLSGSGAIIALSRQHLDRLIEISPSTATTAVLIPAPPLAVVLDGQSGQVRANGRARLGLNEGAFLLSFYGFLYPSKGVETLLVATAKVIRDEPRVRVALIGAISDRAYGDRLYALADSLGISDRISWTGDCDPSTDDASVYLHASDVAVFPFREGARLNNSSLAVASAHGLPIISTLGSSLEPPLESGTNILLCRPDDPDALADIIIDVIRDDKLRDRLRGGSSTLHAEVFSWERCTAAILALLVPRQPGEPT